MEVHEVFGSKGASCGALRRQMKRRTLIFWLERCSPEV